LLDKNGHGALFNAFRNQYKFIAPDPDANSDFPITAHAGAWQTIAAAAGRAMDGGELLLHLIDGGLASDAMNLVDPQKTQIDNLGTEFVTRTRILREGLDLDAPQPYFIAEEEIERAGTVIETRWQRCRWRKGQAIIWLGHQRTTGRGEGSAGLAFDIAVPKK
jgi:hypothetical protein